MQHGMKSVLTYDMLTACFTAECKCGQYVTTGSATPLEAERKINLHANSSVSEPASLPTTYQPATCHKCGASLATLEAVNQHNGWHLWLDSALSQPTADATLIQFTPSFEGELAAGRTYLSKYGGKLRLTRVSGGNSWDYVSCQTGQSYSASVENLRMTLLHEVEHNG